MSTALQLQLDRRSALEQRIMDLQQQLATQHCAPVQQTPIPPITDRAEGPDVDADRWEEQDISVMEGCWELEHTVTIRNIETDENVLYDDWRMCITADGRAEQIMTSQQGDSCEDGLSAEFRGDGNLYLVEPGNLVCDSGFEIFRREINCGLTPAGTLQCISTQPDEARGGSNEFRMRRQ